MKYDAGLINKEIQKLNKVDCIRVVKKNDNAFQLTLNVQSITKNSNSEEPGVKHHFEFNVKITDNYPEEPPIIKPLNNFPFHPHFGGTTFMNFVYNEIKWLDYKEYDKNEKLSEYIIRMARSLQFEQEFINVFWTKIGNEDARKWYLSQIANDPNFFKNNWKKLKINGLSEKKAVKDNFKQKDVEVSTKKNAAPQQRKKFQITSSTQSYQIQSKKIPEFHIEDKSYYNLSQITATNYHLFITRDTKNKIDNHIFWGERNEINANEQGGILLGEVYQDPDKKIIFGIADDAIPARSARGSGAYLEMSHETWKQMIDRVDHLIESQNKKIQIIGWYHTHPNSLDVFMSHTDKSTQRQMFHNDWQFAIVLNPHKRIWQVFQGKYSKPCNGNIVSLKKKIQKLDKKKDNITKSDLNDDLMNDRKFDSVTSLTAFPQKDQIYQLSKDKKKFDSEMIAPIIYAPLIIALTLLIVFGLVNLNDNYDNLNNDYYDSFNKEYGIDYKINNSDITSNINLEKQKETTDNSVLKMKQEKINNVNIYKGFSGVQLIQSNGLTLTPIDCDSYTVCKKKKDQKSFNNLKEENNNQLSVDNVDTGCSKIAITKMVSAANMISVATKTNNITQVTTNDESLSAYTQIANTKKEKTANLISEAAKTNNMKQVAATNNESLSEYTKVTNVNESKELTVTKRNIENIINKTK